MNKILLFLQKLGMGIQWIVQGLWWDLLTRIKGCFSLLHVLFPYSQKIQRVRFSCVKHQGGAAVHQSRSQNLEKFCFSWEIYILFPYLETAVCICIFPLRTATPHLEVQVTFSVYFWNNGNFWDIHLIFKIIPSVPFAVILFNFTCLLLCIL